MKELGLDYGWGPTAFVQWNLEHLHVLLGTPWWASIALTAALARVILYKFYEQASDITARTQLIAPQVKVLRERTKAAREKQDMAAMMQATQEMKALYKMAGIKMLGSTGPLLQIPLAYGMFRLLRGMTALPVPGMEDGGILWITDLTVFVLQAPWYRKWRNLQPFMQSPNSGGGATQSSYKGVITTTARSASANVSEPEASQKGFLGGAVSEIKGALKQTTKRAKTMVNESSGKRTEAEKKAAQKYEERRQKEIEQERFEATEEKQRRREERRQKQQE
ncbi:MAG: hypothetical protein Q9190_003096 [Brigantiaea leucoxantha]